MTRSTLRAAAAAFLADGDVFAWEPAARYRTMAALGHLHTGELDVEGLRAALGAGSGEGSRRSLPKSIAVVSLTGVLSPGESLFSMLGAGTSVRAFMAQVAAAGADPSVKSILLYVDTPGGSVRLMQEASALLRDVRVHTPIIAAVGGVAASAGYWLASNATAVEATQSASVGSIGVFAQRGDVSEHLKREGVTVTTIAAGRYKAEGLETEPLTADERAHLQQTFDAAFDDFVGDVAAGRRVPPARVRESYGEGRLLNTTAALRAGMIDRIAVVEDTIARLAAAPAQVAALQTHRAALVRAQLGPARSRYTRAELEAHRRALRAAADRQGMTDR